jgi:transcription antitermination factor NusA-like protein
MANQYIVELCLILRDEEKLPPKDCSTKIEHDCLDLWSKATIRKYLPDEAKDTLKQKAGKMGGEAKKAMLVIASTKNGARINLAESDSDSQKEQESKTFLNELDRKLATRTISPELLEANKIIADRDQRIQELESQLGNSNAYPSYTNTSILLLSNNLAVEIYNAIRNAKSSGVALQFELEHNGQEVTAVYLEDKT